MGVSPIFYPRPAAFGYDGIQKYGFFYDLINRSFRKGSQNFLLRRLYVNRPIFFALFVYLFPA